VHGQQLSQGPGLGGQGIDAGVHRLDQTPRQLLFRQVVGHDPHSIHEPDYRSIDELTCDLHREQGAAAGDAMDHLGQPRGVLHLTKQPADQGLHVLPVEAAQAHGDR